MKFFQDEEFYGLKHHLFSTLSGATLIGLVLKNGINAIELKQGMIRIVDYDVEEKNAASAITKEKVN